MLRVTKFIKNNAAPLLLVCLVALFWHPILFNNKFFLDDWDFIKVFEAGKFSLAYLFAPHNEHLMPIFKLLFFGLYRLFGVNIVPAMLLAIALHMVNTLLFFKLCALIFKNKKMLSFIIALLFSLSAVYYEVLHWFIVMNTALSLCFLMLTLILMHRSTEKRGRPAYAWSIITSFFVPMNFSLGLLGIFFIVFYYLGVIKKTFSFKRCKEYAAFLLPYLMAWLLFAVIYYFLVIVPRSAPHSGTTLTLNLNLLTMAQFILMAFLGTISKSLALSIFSHPQALLLGILLLLNLIFLVYLLCLYFILNKRRARISLLNDWGVAFFSLGGALLSYAALSLARSNLTADALLNWGRYHYFPYFFLCIFAGNFLPPLFNILSKIFNPSRLKIFAWVILLIFLLIQLISIREKAFSFIKTEGTILKDQPIARHCSPML